MECSADDTAVESWEIADLDESMRRLMLSCNRNLPSASGCSLSFDESPKILKSTASSSSILANSSPASAVSTSVRNRKLSEGVLNQVDQFLREALQNPRERLSVLRLEQDVLKFIRDPSQQQLEFQQLPTSYLRLAAHRVAQHYNLQSMVVQDSNLPDGSGSRIIIRKTSECRLPLVRLAEIPINLPQDECRNNFKVAIKQRPQKNQHLPSKTNSSPSKANILKSVEERKEEYNKARARIFSSSNSSSVTTGAKSDEGSPVRFPDLQRQSSLLSTLHDKQNYESLEVFPDTYESSTLCRSGVAIVDRDSLIAFKPNNKVAIFRDREIDRKDPDYDRNYDRYMQRFDPGFGFSAGPFAVQPLYAPALNYNTEFPQLGSGVPRAHQATSLEHQARTLHHYHGPWGSPSTPSTIAYALPESIIGPAQSYNLNHVGVHSSPAIYQMHSSQYAHSQPGLTYVRSPENVHHCLPQSLQHQHEANSGVARPR